MKISRITIIFSSFLFVRRSGPDSTARCEAYGNPVFEKNCAKCHGKTAEGRHFGGPSLVSEAAMAKSADELRDIITNGKHHMPKYAGKLTPEEINALVDQIKSPPKK